MENCKYNSKNLDLAWYLCQIYSSSFNLQYWVSEKSGSCKYSLEAEYQDMCACIELGMKVRQESRGK